MNKIESCPQNRGVRDGDQQEKAQHPNESEGSPAALNETLIGSHCEIFNTDQGSQFRTHRFTGPLLEKGIQVSMDGRGRALDNIFVERLWRSVKYEKVYLNDFETVKETYHGLRDYFDFYNQRRLHQSLDYQTPAEVYSERSCQKI